MTPYRLGATLGEWTAYVAIALALAWVATGRWRDYPPTEGRSAEQVATVVERRTRLVKRAVLGVAALWILTDIGVTVWTNQHYR
ncbi:hypothetical protein ACFYXJ_09615 [Streptomyces sp. NPDC002667]|uniref:hypothetical protein n=1 Tax=Streptomyces sp. NPDC002667 TaxID=3364657 RepID=UPI0036B3EE1F